MKKLVKVEEVEGEGLMALMGKEVLLWCMNYIYCGTLVGVNDTCVLLQDAGVVYETGALPGEELKDFQKMNRDCYIMIQSIESFYER